MNCQSFKNQIDEAAFTAELNRHLEACSDCKTFREERECLSRLLAQLEQIHAPANFEFGVRAKLNSLPTANGSRVWIRRFAFASPALAAVAVSAFVFTSYDIFSTGIEPVPVAVQNMNVASAPIPSPIVTPTQPTLAATNANPAPSEPIFTKTPARTEIIGERVAMGNILPKQSPRNIVKSDPNETRSATIDEPTLKRDLALTKAQRVNPLGIPDNPQKKMSVNEALSFFGVDLEENGSVLLVRSNTAASENGILAGDIIETVNGQKFAEASLENSLKQITVEISRGGNKRKVTMTMKSN